MSKFRSQPCHAAARPVLIERQADCRCILMVGTHVRTMGGVSSVVRGYIDGGLFQRFDARYISTHRDGSRWTKAVTAVHGWVAILAYLCRGRAPLLHIHLSSRASFWRKWVVCLMARTLRRPYLLHVHGSEFMTFYDDECGVLAQRIVRSSLRHAAVVLALSEQWRDNLLRICPTAAVEVLSNAVPLPRLHRRARGAAQGAPTIVSLGRLGRRKGSFDLVSAFARIAQRFPRARLVCAGDGAVAEVRRHAHGLGVGERVSCPGWLSAEHSRRLLASSTLFALPSYAEGLPMALLEAMSCALPVIASSVGGIPQVLRHGVNGLLVEAGDIDALAAALASLLDEPAQCERLGDAARRTIEQHFSLDASLQRLSGIYRRFGVPQRGGAQ